MRLLHRMIDLFGRNLECYRLVLPAVKSYKSSVMLSGSYFLFGRSFADLLIHSMFLIARKDFLRIYKRKTLTVGYLGR